MKKLSGWKYWVVIILACVVFMAISYGIHDYLMAKNGDPGTWGKLVIFWAGGIYFMLVDNLRK